RFRSAPCNETSMSRSNVRLRADVHGVDLQTRSGTATRAGPRWNAPLWSQGFRPFFLLAGLWGCVSPLVWIAVFAGSLRAPGWLAPSAWHAHEMVFGWVAAAIAGFLLTAVPVWTATAPVRGRVLFGLAALWVAGRVA